MSRMTAPTRSSGGLSNLALNARIFSFVVYSLICYTTIGMQLAVLPGYVHLRLGYSTMLAGLVVSLEYVATVLTRPWAGMIIDRRGARFAVSSGLLLCGLSGVLMVASAALLHRHLVGIALLFAARLALGASESLVGTGATIWGIWGAGVENTAAVISWNGICTYGGVALGAPLGVGLLTFLGYRWVGIAIAAMGFVPLVMALRQQAAPIVHGEKLPYHHVFRRVAMQGTGLGLGSIGFGVLATFITLDFAHRHWSGAAFALTLFGALFISARLLFAGWINRVGGYRVATVCFLLESLGLCLLWSAQTRVAAYAGAALTGFGFSLVFPALGVEAVRPIPPQDKGTALAAYGVFMDFAMMITGPVAGAIIGGWGFPAMYLFAAAAVVLGLLLSAWLASRRTAAASL